MSAPTAAAVALGFTFFLAAAAGGPPARNPDQKKPDTGPSAATVRELPINAKSDAKLKRLLGDGGKLKHTAHYTIGHDTDDATLAAFVTRVEATYGAVTRFADKMGVPTSAPAEKLQIVFFGRFEGYEKFLAKTGMKASEEVPGVYFPTLNRSFFFDYSDAQTIRELKEALAEIQKVGKQAHRLGARPDFTRIKAYQSRIAEYEDKVNRQIVQHEVAHQVMYNIGVHNRNFEANPRWLVEGLAMMFETPPTHEGAGIGAVNQWRLARWRDLAKEGKLPPIRDVISNGDLLLPTATDGEHAYAQAWAMVHYLHRTKQKQLAKYIERVNQRREKRKYKGEEDLKLFEQVFGKLDASFTEKWEEYMKKIPLKRSHSRV
jgi:hypothetical protein